MDVQQQYPSVHWIWGGGISFVYEVHPGIVVKVPKSGEFEREQFSKETKIYDIFSRSAPCHSIVQCFFCTDGGIFLEYMRDVCLSYRIQQNHIRDQQTMVVTKVQKLEAPRLRKEWMNDLAQGVAFLESLNLAHGDLRPENILLDRDRLKLSDFDSTAEIGTDFEACIAPYGRLLNGNESGLGSRGSSGVLASRTEQFALGSLYYLINYGFEVYGDRCLADDPREHGPKVVDLLQHMEFPRLNCDPLIDDIIHKCWHNQYTTVAELAAHTESLLAEETSSGGSSRLDHSAEDCSSKKAICQDLEKRGLLGLLCSGEPASLGFTFEWYRYSSDC
ncbi:kinase domain-containing protein [Aspergillus avenaceus]|uniref:Kinase domain-containing protein n=1 Tax=Aspergillus avenaceus TaxID=36643 RepID=A0A5N6TYX3_ASPAV|nr:kinase domain-containing protein [Aspergillus avenaceus]